MIMCERFHLIESSENVDIRARYKMFIVLQSTLTCPVCHHQASEFMPTDACQNFFDCAACGTRLKPKPGDCCVFCSYGTIPCPPIQENGEGGACCA